MAVLPRRGPRPRTSQEGPHRQLDQQSPPELWGRLVLACTTLPGVREGHSQVSLASSRALLLDDQVEIRHAGSSLAPEPPVEPVHLHGVTDTSLHLCLPEAIAPGVCQQGWGEPHGYAQQRTEILVYGPRDDAELATVLALVEASLAFARAGPTDA